MNFFLCSKFGIFCQHTNLTVKLVAKGAEVMNKCGIVIGILTILPSEAGLVCNLGGCLVLWIVNVTGDLSEII